MRWVPGHNHPVSERRAGGLWSETKVTGKGSRCGAGFRPQPLPPLCFVTVEPMPKAGLRKAQRLLPKTAGSVAAGSTPPAWKPSLCSAGGVPPRCLPSLCMWHHMLWLCYPGTGSAQLVWEVNGGTSR